MLLLLLQLLVLILVLGNAATATKSNSCTGNSATASKLATARNIKLQGAVSGNTNFDGSTNIVINTSLYNQATTVNFSIRGTAKIKRIGNVVTINVEVSCPPKSSTSTTNSVALPSWANPSSHLLTDNVLESSVAIDMNKHCTGYIQIYNNANLRLLTYNTDEQNTNKLRINFTYIVD